MQTRFFARIFTRTRSTFLVGGFVTYFIYREGRERYKELNYSKIYETLPNEKMLTQEYFGTQKADLNKPIHIRAQLFLKRTFRTAYLIILFFPVALLLPLSLLFKSYLYDYWTSLLIKTLERLIQIQAGPLWIKFGQWASHRSDIFGVEMAQKFEKLRESTNPHSMKANHKEIKEAFGKSINQIFDEFDEVPLASGSVAQVHKAVLKGQTVAVKIRHPKIIQKLETDINILYSWMNFFSRVLRVSISMPVTIEEFKRTLVSQTDLRLEARNLKIFCEKFKDMRQVSFPQPVEEYISSNILVESFEEGVSLQEYMPKASSLEKETIANLAIKAAYKMVIYDNFIHADCHAGNILVRYRKEDEQHWMYNKLKEIKETVEDTIYDRVEKIIEYIMNKYDQSHQTQMQTHYEVLNNEIQKDEKNYVQLMKSAPNKCRNLQLVFLDAGLITILNKEDRLGFLKLIIFVLFRKPLECGHLMMELAQYNGTGRLMEEKFLNQMVELFNRLCCGPRSKINIGSILQSMLEILGQHGMAVEGNFSALLANVIVMEGIVKELNPDINMFSKAASFLMHLRTIDKTIDEAISQIL